MGSDLYRMKVLEKAGRTVKLHVEVVHPDSNYLSDGLSFALMVLHEGAYGKDSLLAKEMSFDDTMDRGWLELYTKGFIESAQTQILSGSSDGQEKKDWIKGTLTITVTDPAWISHLEVGAEFDSRAFDPASNFQDCAPIRPGQVDPNAKMPEPYISVPGSIFRDVVMPTVVRAPAYSSSAWHAPNMKKGTFTAADLKDLDGQVVMAQGPYDDSPKVSILSAAGDTVRVFTVSEGGSGYSSSNTFEGSIGKAELIPGKRLGSRFRLSSLLSSLQPKLLSATVEGDSATFRISVPPGNTNFESLSEDQLIGGGLQLLLTPLLPKDNPLPTLLAPSPLSWTIEREVLARFPAEERQMTQYIDGQMIPTGDTLPDLGGIARRLGRAIVAKAEVVAKPDGSLGDVDSMNEAQQRAVLEKPWPELVVKVTPHHAVYLQHLAQKFEPAEVSWFPDAEQSAPVTPATGPTEFGKKKAPPPAAQSSAPSYSSGSSSPTQSSASPNKTLKIVGIVLGALVGLCLLCMVLGAIFGKH